MQKRILLLLKTHYAFLVFIILYFAIFSWKLVAHPAPFFDWDESIYAQVAREMIQKPSLVPLWQGQYWLDKPPLVPLFYGFVLKLLPFIQPEISTRMTTLVLTVVALSLLYTLYFKVIKETFLTTLVILLTSLIPIFLQRSQVLNIDVFLLIGWVGYILFHKNFRWSLFFLAVAVLSKTLVGFYAVGIIFLYYLLLFFTKKISQKELTLALKRIGIQVGILSIWYIVMFIFFGKDFWIQHIYETHFKRVSSSIESHFGQRTFYIDLLFEQFARTPLFVPPRGVMSMLYALIMSLSTFIIFLSYIKTDNFWHKLGIKLKKLPIPFKLSAEQLLFATFIIPWFLFLNVTKTKIFWYSYPYIPQFAFLLLLPLLLLKKWKYLYYGALTLTLVGIIQFYFIQNKVLTAEYSKLEPHQKLAVAARNQCSELNVLVDSQTRKDYKVLSGMNLTITTTRWWGNHPSMVYYFGKKINFIYDDQEELFTQLGSAPINSCLVIDKADYFLVSNDPSLQHLTQFDTLYLEKKVAVRDTMNE